MQSNVHFHRFLACAGVSVLLAACGGRTPAATTPAPAAVAPLDIAKLPDDAGFEAAVARGTRTRTGRPGARYWQQWARYTIEAELDPAPARLTGQETVRYFNRSPDRLDSVAVHLYQNLYSNPAVVRQNGGSGAGMTLTRVAAQGNELKQSAGTAPGYRVDGTIGWLRLPRPVAPGDSVDLEIAWRYTVPMRGTREGHDEELYFMGYWYPQIAVYDDVNGWQVDQYLGQGEFYMGYADYDLTLTVPNAWIVAATGVLRDSASVLAPFVRERLAGLRAKGSDIVRVVTGPERGTATVRSPSGKLKWKFDAKNVRHTVWATSQAFFWDATNAVVGDRDGDGRADTASINTFYRPEAPAWTASARFTQHAIEFGSQLIFPYTYPQMSAVQGLEPGMEYPMMTLITSERDTLELLATIEHEVGHMWFPMQVGSDEKRFAWMDEGLTQYNGSLAEVDYLKKHGGTDSHPERNSAREYVTVSRSGQEEPMMRHSDRFRGYQTYATSAYDKPLVALRALDGLLGHETFMRAYREYGTRWKFKHPTPRDFFDTFNDVSGQDLSWFWRSWFFETWQLDLAVAGVRDTANVIEIDIENRGRIPMPARVVVTRSDGTTQRLEVPVTVWLAGATKHTLRVAKSPAVVRVEIDPEEFFADVNRRNNRWDK
jgi:hypothetical protein